MHYLLPNLRFQNLLRKQNFYVFLEFRGSSFSIVGGVGWPQNPKNLIIRTSQNTTNEKINGRERDLERHIAVSHNPST